MRPRFGAQGRECRRNRSNHHRKQSFLLWQQDATMGVWAQVVCWLWRCFVWVLLAAWHCQDWRYGKWRIGCGDDRLSSAPARFAVAASRDLVFGPYCCGLSVAAGLCRRGACDASTLQGVKRGSPTLHQCWCYVRLHIHTAAAPRLLQDIVCWSLGHFPALFGCSSSPWDSP